MFLRDFWNDFPNYLNLKREAIVIPCECHMCHNNAILDMQKKSTICPNNDYQAEYYIGDFS